jgi:hemerythrin-like metal-binding protein
MAYFTWTASLMTGIDLIDEQHQKLLSIINKLHDAMKNRRAKDELLGLLEELDDYTKYHFGLEQRAFVKYSYPKKEEHLKLHKIFVDKIEELIAETKKGNTLVSIDALAFLTEWITNHIQKIDVQYVPYLKDKILQ